MVRQLLIKMTWLCLALMLTACGMKPVAGHVKGYLTTTSGKILKNDQGQCWRTVDWQPSMAVAECDPDLAFIVTGQVVLPPEPEPEPEPEIVPEEVAQVSADAEEAQAAPDVVEPSMTFVTLTEDKPFTLSGDTSFYFGLSALTPEAKGIIRRLAVRLKEDTTKDVSISVTGYADRLGSAAFNQTLSAERAEAVRQELVKNGLDAALIRAEGKGSADAITDQHLCPDSLPRGDLIVCLTPDRRVEIAVSGMQQTTRTVPASHIKDENR